MTADILEVATSIVRVSTLYGAAARELRELHNHLPTSDMMGHVERGSLVEKCLWRHAYLIRELESHVGHTETMLQHDAVDALLEVIKKQAAEREEWFSRQERARAAAEQSKQVTT